MRRHILPILLLILLSTITFSPYFFSFDLITFGDWNVDFEERIKELLSFPTIWQSASGFGSIYITLSFWPFLFVSGLLAYLNVSSALAERFIFFWPAVILSPISMYSFSYYIFKARLPAFVSAIVYSFSASALSLASGVATLAVAQSLSPLLLLLFFLTLEKRKVIYTLLTGILTFAIGFYEFRVLYLIFLVLSFYFLYYVLFILKTENVKRDILKYLLLTGIIAIQVLLLNTYWFIGIRESVGSVTSEGIFRSGLFGQQFVNIAVALTNFPYFWTGAKTSVFTLEPIPIYFWFIPMCAFLGLLYAKKEKKIIFFSILGLLSIFLVKMDGEPFRGSYTWLFEHIPGFNAFRYSTHFSYYTQLSYAIVIGAFVAYLQNWKQNSTKKKFISYLTIFFIAALFLWNTKPFLTKEIGNTLILRKIPKEYLDLKDFFLSKKEFFRTFSIPYMQRFTFYSNVHPALGFLHLPQNLQSLNPKLLSLENVRFIILPFDAVDDVYKHFAPQVAFERFVKSSLGNNFKEIFGFEKIRIWESLSIFPHIMQVQDVVYIDGTKDIRNIMELPTSDRVSYYFKRDIKKKNNSVDLMDLWRDATMLDKATKVFLVADCIRCEATRQYYDYTIFPFARITPDSPLYFIIESKDKKRLLSTKSLEERLTIEVFLLEKRAVEIQEMINKDVHSQYIIRTILKNNAMLDSIEKNLKAVEWNIQKNDTLLNVYDYLQLERRTFSDILGKSLVKEIKDERIIDLLQKSIHKIDKIIGYVTEKVWKTQDGNYRLTVLIPEDGEYSIMIKDDTTIDISKNLLTLEQTKLQLSSKSGIFWDFGKLKLKKGLYKVEYNTEPVNLLATSSSELSLSQKKYLSKTVLPINNLDDWESDYWISFDYKISSGEVRIVILDDATLIDETTGEQKYILDRVLTGTGDQWINFKIPFRPHMVSSQGELQFLVSSAFSEKGANFQIKNLSVTKALKPIIVFSKDKNKFFSTPEIIFQEMNPTEYKVEVKNATEPFFLAFSEGYDSNWHIYNDYEKLGRNSSVTAEYFGGKVKELEYANIDSLGVLRTLLQEDYMPDDIIHVAINGFGNGWLINKKGDYVFKILYKPQGYTLIGSFITILTLIMSISGLIWLSLKEILKKKNTRTNISKI